MFSKKIYGIIIDNKYVGSDMYFGICNAMGIVNKKLISVSMGDFYTTITTTGKKSKFKKMIKTLEKNGYFFTLNESGSFALVQAA